MITKPYRIVCAAFALGLCVGLGPPEAATSRSCFCAESPTYVKDNCGSIFPAPGAKNLWKIRRDVCPDKRVYCRRGRGDLQEVLERICEPPKTPDPTNCHTIVSLRCGDVSADITRSCGPGLSESEAIRIAQLSCANCRVLAVPGDHWNLSEEELLARYCPR